MSDKRNSK